MLRKLPILAAFFLVVAYGVAEGFWTDRWRPSHAVEQAVARLAGIPMNVGDWHGEAEELDARQLRVGEIQGYLMRRYVHRPTGQLLSVLIVCGRPGPIAVHTPDVCFRGAGYGTVAPPAKYPLELAPPAEFWTAQFHKTGPAPDPLRILWSWNDGRGWTAADHPRWQFARSGALYKLYVLRPSAGRDESLESDPGLDFLRLFLPEVQRHLFEEHPLES